jgi:hypothetical protein
MHGLQAETCVYKAIRPHSVCKSACEAQLMQHVVQCCRASRIDSPDGINVDAVLKAVLRLARKHEVHHLSTQQHTDFQVPKPASVNRHAVASANWPVGGTHELV